MRENTKERWERACALFSAARALDARARDSFLTVACEGDPALRAEVERLLAADTPDDDFLENPPWADLAESVAVGLSNPVRLAGGQVVNERYLIEKELAEGGQAEVFLAHDQHLLNRPVVLKVMRADSHGNRWLKSRFQKEMQALARIDHPGVVGILDVGELEDGSPYLIIQYIPGVSLRQLLAQGPVPPARAAEILRQMGSALRAAHLLGIAHRDLKPENVMLEQRNDGTDVVRLIDFGIAKIDRSGSDTDTSAVLVAGTVRYMAPEQFEGRHSPACDVYTMALVACEMLGGHPHIRALPAKTSRGTRQALEAALAYRPEDRPADVKLWSDWLARTLVPRGRRVRRIAAGVVLAVLALGAAAALERKLLLDSAEPVRVVETAGALDPLTEGFRALDDVAGSGVADNPTRTGYDGWHVQTRSRGMYLRRFSGSQERSALQRGWKLTSELRADEGAAFASADFSSVDGRHFAVVVAPDGNGEIVTLPTQLAPEMRGLQYAQSPIGAYHRYELVYDPELKTADLWIDGQRRLSDYRGIAENVYGLSDGLVFGAAIYKSAHAAVSFRSVRLEINR